MSKAHQTEGCFAQSLRRCALIVVRPLDTSPAVILMGIKPYRCHWQLDAILLFSISNSPNHPKEVRPVSTAEYCTTTHQICQVARQHVSASMSYVLLLLSSTISSIFATIGHICQNPLITASCRDQKLVESS
jgi:hypothetical protein